MMKNLIATLALILLVCLVVAPAFAQSKSCDELKTEIAAKLDSKSVSGYQLEIVKTEEVKEQTVAGSCEGGTKKITYSKGGQASEAARRLLRLQCPRLRRNLLPQDPTKAGLARPVGIQVPVLSRSGQARVHRREKAPS